MSDSVNDTLGKPVGLVILDPPVGNKKAAWDKPWEVADFNAVLATLKDSPAVADSFVLAVYSSTTQQLSAILSSIANSPMCSASQLLTFVEDRPPGKPTTMGRLGVAEGRNEVLLAFCNKGGPGASFSGDVPRFSLEEEDDEDHLMRASTIRRWPPLKSGDPLASVFDKWKAVGSSLMANPYQKSVLGERLSVDPWIIGL